jgi:hypothetical protein
MHDTSGVESRLQQATTLPDMLAASFDAFEVIRLLARDNEDRVPGLFAAFMTAADAAVDGREAITAAPSLPPGSRNLIGSSLPTSTCAGVREIADDMAALAVLLSQRLGYAATLSIALSDQVACEEAVAAAGRICQLMARGHDDTGLW